MAVRRGRREVCGCYTTRQLNTHGTETRELLYPWHPWAGCQVHIHEVVEKAGGEVFRCSCTASRSDRLLEVPSWMFERAASATWRIGAAPHVDGAAFAALAMLLQDATPVAGASPQLRDLSAELGSHDTNRRDVHAAPAQAMSVRSVLQTARCRDGADAAMAGVARRDAPGADKADGPPNPRSRRRHPRSRAEGDGS